MAEALVAVHMQRINGLAHDFRVGGLCDFARLDSIEVHGDKLDAVGVVSGEVGVDEDLRDRGGDVVRRSRGGKQLAADLLQILG